MRLLILLPFILLGCTFGKSSLGEKVVLDVNGKRMTAQQFSQELAYRLKNHDALSAKDPKVVKMLKAAISDDFIIQTLSEEWARENGVILKAEELEEQIKAVQKNYPDDLAFQQALAEEGVTFKAWRERLQASSLQKLIVKKLVENLPAPNANDLQNYFNENKEKFAVRESAQVRQILVASESDAKIIDDQLKRGKRMTDLAKKYSISPEGPQGGTVGWVEKGMTQVFEPAFHMKVGQRSPVVKSDFGYHIFELLARKPSRTQTFPEAKDDIKRILLEKNEQSLYLAWLEAQTRKARVFKDQAFIDALQVETKAQ